MPIWVFSSYCFAHFSVNVQRYDAQLGKGSDWLHWVKQQFDMVQIWSPGIGTQDGDPVRQFHHQCTVPSKQVQLAVLSCQLVTML